MKINSLVLLTISLFFMFSCDDGVKFNNPNDQNADIADSIDSQNDEDKDSADTENSGKKQGELDGECYPNKTCNDGFICDKDNNICIKDSESSENNDDSDSTSEQSDGDSDANTTPDSSDSNPDENADTDSGDSTPDNDTDTTPTSPCNPNPCSSVANSTKECIETGDTTYSCKCKSGYNWTGSACQKNSSGGLTPLGSICTGQDKCYNNTEEISCPTVSNEDFFGQDAWYASLGKCYPQSFTVKTISDQNVVLDNNTGLMWQQTIFMYISWDDAVSYCNDLSYAGYSDWRLPTPHELQTIVNNSRHNPAIDETYFPDTPTSDFWSSSTYVYKTDYAWCTGSLSDKTYSNNVRCVREKSLPNSTFESSTINGDIIVTDSKTGLIWQGNYVSGRTWKAALAYCEKLTYAGYTDWRLPNINELSSLVNYERYDPASDFPEDMPSKRFWSSSTSNNEKKYALSVSFDRGDFYNYYKTSDSYSNNGGIATVQMHVRCVRN